MNLTDGDVELYVEGVILPIIIVPTNINLAFDGFPSQRQMSVKNSTGTGGSVYIHTWRYEGP